MIAPHRLSARLSALAAVAATLGSTVLASTSVSACNAITGTGKYDVVDCPSGACDDSGAGIGGDAQPAADAAANDSAPGVDSSVAPLPDCGSNRGAVRLTVTGGSGSVTSNPGGLSVASGSTADACFGLDTLELRTSGSSATWTGVSCKDGPTSDRCELTVRAGGTTVTAALP